MKTCTDERLHTENGAEEDTKVAGKSKDTERSCLRFRGAVFADHGPNGAALVVRH